jgi:hypothetical protein
LISRFGWGLTVGLEPPELEMRVAILLAKAASSGMRIDEQVAFFVAKHIRSNVRELEGALKRILAFASFHGREINLALAKDALRDLLAVQNRQISIENIQKTVADYYKIRILGYAFEKALARRRKAATGRDGAGKRVDATFTARNRQQFRRSRPHHSASCVQAGRETARNASRTASRRQLSAASPAQLKSVRTPIVFESVPRAASALWALIFLEKKTFTQYNLGISRTRVQTSKASPKDPRPAKVFFPPDRGRATR